MSTLVENSRQALPSFRKGKEKTSQIALPSRTTHSPPNHVCIIFMERKTLRVTSHTHGSNANTDWKPNYMFYHVIIVI